MEALKKRMELLALSNQNKILDVPFSVESVSTAIEGS